MDKENTSTFLAQNLRFLRKRKKLSQEELAQRVGLNRGNIASYENGSAEPKLCNLIKLANLFGATIIELTQTDLSKKRAKLNGKVAHLPTEGRSVDHFALKAKEIETVFQSLHTCCAFKTKSLSEVPKDLQIVLVNFEQLHEAAQTLLVHHKELINFVREGQQPS